MPGPVTLEVDVPSDVRLLSYFSRLAQETVRLVVEDGRADALCAAVDVCLTEALTNAIQHAHGSDSSRPLKVSIHVRDGVLTVRVHDSGPGFELASVPEPSFEELREHGRGLYIIKCSMDAVSYVRANGGNVLEMTKRLL